MSRTQISWCVKDCVLNPQACENKVLEVVTQKINSGKKDKDSEPAFEAYDLSVVSQMAKVKSLGNPAEEGSPAWFSARYAYAPSKLDTFMKTMAFGGSAPEVINGRLAMLAVVALVGQVRSLSYSLSLARSPNARPRIFAQ